MKRSTPYAEEYLQKAQLRLQAQRNRPDTRAKTWRL